MYKQILSTTPSLVVVFTVVAQVTAPAFGQDATVRNDRVPSAVLSWIRSDALPLPASNTGTTDLSGLLAHSRIIGLGEATHGQHEAFELKRCITMQLIRDHGFRTVAYEASASKARACNDYIQGLTDDPAAAMRGFGMLIWAVEENAALLEDLRAWNKNAAAVDRVRFIGCDAQDAEVVVERIAELVPDQGLTDRMNGLVERSIPAVQQLFQGDRAAIEALSTEIDQFEQDLQRSSLPAEDDRSELRLRMLEFRSSLLMYGTAGGRDKAMAELLTAQLGPGEQCVLWAHNGHVQRSPLDYLGSEELAMGGHLAQAFKHDYYALGFAFGSGGFQANAQDRTGSWGFKRYHHAAPVTGSLEADLAAAGMDDLAIDLRTTPDDTTVQRWLRTPHGHRWWGGYNVPDDHDERTRDATQLMQMIPADHFDGLVFLLRTTPATPLDRSRIIATVR